VLDKITVLKTDAKFRGGKYVITIEIINKINFNL
jgi:hypothetical protein